MTGRVRKNRCYTVNLDGQVGIFLLGFVWIAVVCRATGPESRDARNEAHAGGDSPAGPKNAFGNARIGS
jgi:hypothetical protein